MLIGYARVSTLDQNPNLQLDALKAAGCEKTFVERASGSQRERPELSAALTFMRKGDALVVWKLDRLARSLPQLIQTVAELQERGVGFRSLTEALDTTSAAGRLTFHIFGAMADFERELIRERTRAGLTAARARGRTGGRPRKATDEALRVAKALLADSQIGIAEAAHRAGLSVSTLYAHMPAARSAAQQSKNSSDTDPSSASIAKHAVIQSWQA